MIIPPMFIEEFYRNQNVTILFIIHLNVIEKRRRLRYYQNI